MTDGTGAIVGNTLDTTTNVFYPSILKHTERYHNLGYKWTTGQQTPSATPGFVWLMNQIKSLNNNSDHTVYNMGS